MRNVYMRPLVYFIYWMLFFILARSIFIIYHHVKTTALSAGEILNVFLYGAKMDASFTAYICIFPFASFLIQAFLLKFNYQKWVHYYTIILIVLISILTITDLEIYKVWGYRLDNTPLQYFNNPTEMVASASAVPFFLLIFILVATIVLSLWVYKKLIKKIIYQGEKRRNVLSIFFLLFCLVILFIPIRGGLTQSPLSHSSVYFSKKLYANHAALNVPWNVMQAILNNSNTNNPYVYYTEDVAKKRVDSLYYPVVNPALSLLNTQRPNIIFLILESYTSKLIGCLNGQKEVTPNIDSIAGEGMLFTNIYASGTRSEKGLVAILSGYPSQPATSIILTPPKTENLPHLNLDLKKIGYHSAYYYGGEINFSNIKSYVLNAGYDRIISKSDFDKNEYNSKWGVHDHILLNKFFKDINIEQQPFFYTLFTLSSHEPYDVPIAPKFAGNDELTKFKNSMYYTDEAIGNFIRQAKQQPWWKNTLIVMVADHGHRLPGEDEVFAPNKFKIPLILSGGALRHVKSINNNIASQTDIATTILQQMNISTINYKWGKNLLDSSRQFAFYNFNDGFGYLTPAGTLIIDNISKKIISKDAGVTEEQIKTAKAYMQHSFQDFLKR